MERIARIIVSRSRQILAATGIVTLLAAVMLFRMDFNADVSSFVLEGNETGEEFKALQDKYGTADPINVLVSFETGSFRDKQGSARAGRTSAISSPAVDGSGQVASIVPDVNPLTGAPNPAGGHRGGSRRTDSQDCSPRVRFPGCCSTRRPRTRWC